jgi:hypothetical protein
MLTQILASPILYFVVVFALIGLWRLSSFVIPKTRFKTMDEFCKAIDILVGRLIAEGHSGDAQKLNTLLHDTACTTGSELLGELMLALKDMRGPYSRELRKEINQCFEFALHYRTILRL